MNRLKASHKVSLLLLSPLLVIIAGAAIVIGLAYAGGYDPAQSFSEGLVDVGPEIHLLAQYSVRCLIFPFQLVFIGIIAAVALAIYRRRWRISSRILNPLSGVEVNPEAKGYFDPLREDWDHLVRVRPERQVTLTHIGASLVAVVAISVAVILGLSQFFSWTDLAIIVTALTSALAWGARLQVSDLLGGISNLIENNFNVGDRLGLRHLKLNVEGIIERVDLRFTWMRAPSGELITVPFGEIRTLRNYSRSAFAGVYVTFPIPGNMLEPAITRLEELATQSPTLIPGLIEPWHLVSQTGALSSIVELSLYGRGPVGYEQELQLAMHALVWEQLQLLGAVLDEGGTEH